MEISKILYATDFSHQDVTTLALATSLARDSSATLIICHVYEPPAPLVAMAAHDAIPATGAEEQAERLAQIFPLDPGVICEHRMVHGSPSDGIVKLARDEQVDLIVMSTHGHSGLRHLLMGSVAEQVVRNAHCPVLTLKQAERPSTPPTQ